MFVPSLHENERRLARQGILVFGNQTKIKIWGLVLIVTSTVCEKVNENAYIARGTLSPGHVITSPISFFFAFLNRSRQADVVSITIYLNSRLLIEKQIGKVVRDPS